MLGSLFSRQATLRGNLRSMVGDVISYSVMVGTGVGRGARAGALLVGPVRATTWKLTWQAQLRRKNAIVLMSSIAFALPLALDARRGVGEDFEPGQQNALPTLLTNAVCSFPHLP